jgi:phospholipid/cholesterol/gamma-HCH transport system substrate-binding protein
MALQISREIKVGVVGLITLGLLLYGLSLLKGSSLVGKDFVLNSYYDNVNGLKKGGFVLYRGMQVGRVSDMALDPKLGKIRVELEISQPIDIPTDTRATIFSPSVMSDPAVRLDFGGSSKNLATGNTIKDSLEGGLVANFQSQIDPIRKEAEVLSKQLNQIAGWVNHTLPDSNQSQNSIRGILDNANSSVANIKDVSGRFDEVLVKVNKAIASIEGLAGSAKNVVENIDGNKGNINGTISKLDATMSNIEQFSDTLAVATEEIRVTLLEAKKTIANLTSISQSIKDGNGSIGMLMKDKKLYENANSSVSKLDSAVSGINQLIQNINKHPKDYLNVNAKVVVFERKDKK